MIAFRLESAVLLKAYISIGQLRAHVRLSHHLSLGAQAKGEAAGPRQSGHPQNLKAVHVPPKVSPSWSKSSDRQEANSQIQGAGSVLSSRVAPHAVLVRCSP